MDKDYQSACSRAKKYNHKLLCSDFKEWATVKHMDRSCFFFNCALLEVYLNRFLIVYSEHHQPMVFFMEDLCFAGYGHGLATLDDLVTKGWYVYLAPVNPPMGQLTKLKTGITQSFKDLEFLVSYVDRNETKKEAENSLKNLREISRTTKFTLIDNFI